MFEQSLIQKNVGVVGVVVNRLASSGDPGLRPRSSIQAVQIHAQIKVMCIQGNSAM